MSERFSRRQMLAGVAAGTTASIAGCGGDGDSDDTTTTTSDDDPTDTTTTTQQQQLADELTVALPSDPTLGTWSVYGGVTPYYTNVLEPLIWVSDEMELVPWLATDWESTGETSWEFTIRDGVTFHNGETLTAEHVAWSFEQIINEWAWAPGWIHIGSPDDVTALDDRTVEFVTTAPFPNFPGTIAHNMVAIQHPDRSREEMNVIGTGPYEVTNRVKGQRVETESFDNYWNGDVQMPNLTFRVITDPTTRSLALENNEVDVIYEPPTSKIESLESSSNTNVETQTSPGALFVGFHNYKTPTDDVSLRKALNYATSQETLVQTILNDVGIPARGPIAQSIYWSGHENLPTYERDVEQATSLVEESSYDGETLQFLINTGTTGGRTIASALQQWYNEIGVDVSIQSREESAFEDAVRAGEGHLVLESSGSNSGAADYLIYESFHSEGDVNQRLYNENDTGLYNPGGQVDTLIEEGFQTGDRDVKEQKYEQALQIIMEDEAAVIPLTYQEYVVGSWADVVDLDLRPINEMVRWPNTKHFA